MAVISDKHSKTPLARLTKAAQALPGLAGLSLVAGSGAVWAQDDGESNASVRHFRYGEEGDTARSNSSADRYEVEATQLQVQNPLPNGWQGSFSYKHETMSGATPWFTQQQGDELVQVLSRASEKRDELSGEVVVPTDEGDLALSAFYSDENDYTGQQMSVTYTRSTAQSPNSWSVSLKTGSDDIDARGEDRPKNKELKSHSIFAAFGVDLDRFSRVQMGYGYSMKDGYLSDPYKLVILNNTRIDDQRPGERASQHISLKYRHYVQWAQAALNADYQYYWDDWDVVSHTLTTTWHQTVGEHWDVAPSLRYYTQADSFFYQPFYNTTRDDGYYSTDYRLSSFGAITMGLQVTRRFPSWQLVFSWDRYQSDGDKGLDDDEVNNPGLIDFDLVSLGFDYNF